MSQVDILDMKTRVRKKASDKHLGQEDRGSRTSVIVTSSGHNGLV